MQGVTRRAVSPMSEGRFSPQLHKTVIACNDMHIIALYKRQSDIKSLHSFSEISLLTNKL
jgi:hypothetical protein